jgi:hypothetical protein
MDTGAVKREGRNVRQAVDWTKWQRYFCHFYPSRDCPGWYPGQPCEQGCQRNQKTPTAPPPETQTPGD